MQLRADAEVGLPLDGRRTGVAGPRGPPVNCIGACAGYVCVISDPPDPLLVAVEAADLGGRRTVKHTDARRVRAWGKQSNC